MSATPLHVQRRVALLSAILGAASIAVPHFALLIFTGNQTFFQRESTLWMSCALLFATGVFAGVWPERLRLAISIMSGAVLGVVIYLLATVDVGGPQFYGAISPMFLLVVALGTSFLIMFVPILFGVAAGSIIKSLATRAKPC